MKIEEEDPLRYSQTNLDGTPITEGEQQHQQMVQKIGQVRESAQQNWSAVQSAAGGVVGIAIGVVETTSGLPNQNLTPYVGVISLVQSEQANSQRREPSYGARVANTGMDVINFVGDTLAIPVEWAIREVVTSVQTLTKAGCGTQVGKGICGAVADKTVKAWSAANDGVSKGVAHFCGTRGGGPICAAAKQAGRNFQKNAKECFDSLDQMGIPPEKLGATALNVIGIGVIARPVAKTVRNVAATGRKVVDYELVRSSRLAALEKQATKAVNDMQLLFDARLAKVGHETLGRFESLERQATKAVNDMQLHLSVAQNAVAARAFEKASKEAAKTVSELSYAAAQARQAASKLAKVQAQRQTLLNTAKVGTGTLAPAAESSASAQALSLDPHRRGLNNYLNGKGPVIISNSEAQVTVMREEFYTAIHREKQILESTVLDHPPKTQPTWSEFLSGSERVELQKPLKGEMLYYKSGEEGYFLYSKGLTGYVPEFERLVRTQPNTAVTTRAQLFLAEVRGKAFQDGLRRTYIIWDPKRDPFLASVEKLGEARSLYGISSLERAAGEEALKVVDTKTWLPNKPPKIGVDIKK